MRRLLLSYLLLAACQQCCGIEMPEYIFDAYAYDSLRTNYSVQCEKQSREENAKVQCCLIFCREISELVETPSIDRIAASKYSMMMIASELSELMCDDINNAVSSIINAIDSQNINYQHCNSNCNKHCVLNDNLIDAASCNAVIEAFMSACLKLSKNLEIGSSISDTINIMKWVRSNPERDDLIYQDVHELKKLMNSEHK